MKVCLACEQRFQADGWQCPACGKQPAYHAETLVFAPALAAENDGFGAAYFANLAPLEASNFWFRARNRLLIWALHHFFPQARSMLEIGCGTGFVLAGMHTAYPTMQLAGSDIFIEGLDFARQRVPQATLFQMDARAIPYDQEFDVVGAFDVLEHIDEDEQVLAQLFQATRPGGGILLTVPQHRFLWSYVDDYSFHKRRYTRHELLTKVERAGFVPVLVTSFVSFLLPLMLLSRLRWLSPHARAHFDSTAELAVAPHINATFEEVLQIERLLIAKGYTLPAGGSLLLVGKRAEVL
jgi:SAM-dependent methyltransferase